MTVPALDRAPARTPAWWVFWGSLASVGYAYVGFPVLAVAHGLLRRKEHYEDATAPAVSVVIAAHNEGATIGRKLEGTLALDYPHDRLEVVVGSDGSTDATADVVRAMGSDRVRLLELPRRGKGPTLDDAVAASRGEILVFTDADVVPAPDAMRQLVAPFADVRVGAVAAEKRDRDHGATRAARVSWRARSTVRRSLSRGGSVSGAQGHLYAVRRELYRPPPPGVVDDFAIPAQALVRGRRLVYAPGAVVSPLPGAFATDATRVSAVPAASAAHRALASRAVERPRSVEPAPSRVPRGAAHLPQAAASPAVRAADRALAGERRARPPWRLLSRRHGRAAGVPWRRGGGRLPPASPEPRPPAGAGAVQVRRAARRGSGCRRTAGT